MSWQSLKTQAREQLLAGEVGRAAHTLVEAINGAPDEPSLYVDLIQVCLLAGSAKDALKAAFELRRIDPENGRYAYLHAISSLAAGDVHAAKHILEETLRKTPDAWEPRQSLAQVMRLQKDDARAKTLLEEAVKLAPAEEGPANDLAVLLLEKKEAVAAVPVLERLLKAKPRALGARLNLALAFVQLGQKADAKPHAQAAAKSDDPGVAEQAARLLGQL